MVLDPLLTDLRLLLGGIGQLELDSSSKHTPQFFVPSGFFLTWYPFSSTFVEHQGLYPVTWLKSYVHAWYVLLFKSSLKGNTHGSLKTAFLLTKNEYNADEFPVLHSENQKAWIYEYITYNKVETCQTIVFNDLIKYLPELVTAFVSILRKKVMPMYDNTTVVIMFFRSTNAIDKKNWIKLQINVCQFLQKLMRLNSHLYVCRNNKV